MEVHQRRTASDRRAMPQKSLSRRAQLLMQHDGQRAMQGGNVVTSSASQSQAMASLNEQA